MPSAYEKFENTVEQLRKQGTKVRVHHWRYAKGDNENLIASKYFEGDGWKMSEKGGLTKVSITFGNTTTEGVAHCSLEDNYDKRRGVRIALGRALKESWRQRYMPS